MKTLASVALSCSLLTATPALAQADWFASLYTPEGVELRVDEGVFALYVLFNAMGYDDAKVVRAHPLPKRQFHPVRQAVREKAGAIDPELRKQADAFFDSHALPAERYIAFASGAANNELKGLEGLLKQVREKTKSDELWASSSADQRKLLRAYLPVLDGPLQRARKLLKQPENDTVIVVVNVMEAQDRATGALRGNDRLVMVGPSEQPNVEGVVQEYARTVLLPLVSKRLGKGQGSGAEELAGFLGMAVALKATQAKDSAFDAAASRGYFGVREATAKLDEGGSLDGWVSEALSKRR